MGFVFLDRAPLMQRSGAGLAGVCMSHGESSCEFWWNMRAAGEGYSLGHLLLVE